MNEKFKTEMISRRKALSLLGFGAALGFTLSSALEPLEAEAQEATTPPAAPAAATGTHGMQRRSRRDAPLAISDGTRAVPVNLRPLRRRHRSSGPFALKRLIARFDDLGIANALSGLRNERDRRRKEKEETKVPRFRRIDGKSIL